MIAAYRSYHFLIWRILAVVLPLAFVYAVIVRPWQIARKPVADNDFIINTSPLSDSTSTVEILVSQPIRSPSCIVRKIGSDTTLLGRIGQTGKYEFIIGTNSRPEVIELYDPIERVVLKSYSLPKNIPAGPR